MNPIEVFTFVDLEMNQPSGKIIQIGAVVANIRTGEVLERLSAIVNPFEPLNPFIIELTGITEERINNEGIMLEEAYIKLWEMHKKHGSFINPVTWGGGDVVEILEQMKGNSTLTDFPPNFGRRWIDVKTIFVSWRFANRQPIQGGLGRSMVKVGLKFEGRKHDALDDAFNTFRMYMRMLKLFKADNNVDKKEI
jgi:inhibitor of KinA sporulation pathway (predicted exonuclease)